MNIPGAPMPLDRDVLPAAKGGRRDGADARAFDVEVGKLEGRGGETPRRAETRPEASEQGLGDAPEKAPDDEAPAEPRRAAGEMLGLIDAANRARTPPPAEEAQAGEPAGHEGAADDAEVPASPRAGRETADVITLARGRVKLEVVHMETHFEPGQDGGVIVRKDGEAQASGEAADEDALLRILSGPSGKADREAGTETVAIRPRFDETLARLGAAEGEAAPVSKAASGRSAAGRATLLDGRSARFAALEERFAPAAAPAVASSTTAPTGNALPMTGQIAARIVDAFAPGSGGPKGEAELPSGETHLRMRAGGAALKTLTIQLQPETLGTLDVSMRLVDGQLTLELSASRMETARVLLEDKASLKSLLEKAGFSVDESAITVVARDTVPAAQRGAETGGEGTMQRQGEPAGQEAGRQNRPQKDSEPDRRQPDRGGENASSARQPSSSVYL
ncbi:flagellar hook-length control protein FliK [Aureimonas populi]|uniref:Flagellar hook-length control protein FliK n=1 Tax=Aureimonas populi TaxID=1701758 RepID=A0ABW5CGG3_9HYPH|nr:flagellar hook-length control protein FliK [Aureimonas populi]